MGSLFRSLHIVGLLQAQLWAIQKISEGGRLSIITRSDSSSLLGLRLSGCKQAIKNRQARMMHTRQEHLRLVGDLLRKKLLSPPLLDYELRIGRPAPRHMSDGRYI